MFTASVLKYLLLKKESSDINHHVDEALVSLVLELRQQRRAEINLKRRRSSIQVWTSNFISCHITVTAVIIFVMDWSMNSGDTHSKSLTIQGGWGSSKESALAVPAWRRSGRRWSVCSPAVKIPNTKKNTIYIEIWCHWEYYSTSEASANQTNVWEPPLFSGEAGEP